MEVIQRLRHRRRRRLKSATRCRLRSPFILKIMRTQPRLLAVYLTLKKEAQEPQLRWLLASYQFP